jgi:hypothetical protein
MLIRPIISLILLSLSLLTSPLGASARQAQVQTHYWMTRPISPQTSFVVARGFPYGWHRNHTAPIHHGVDSENRRGTPVVAAADGAVYYAGNDTDKMFGPRPKFYGNVIVIKHDMEAPEGGAVYTLYGHVERIDVKAGERVAKGQPIGGVGKEGIAIWYHLHFEVRVGNPDDYNATRNPELWYPPRPGTGTLIGRMVGSTGELAMGIRFALGGIGVVPGWTYAEGSIHNDPSYGENFVVGDLPKGCYQMRVKNNRGGYAYNQQHCIKDGETQFIEVKLDKSMR